MIRGEQIVIIVGLSGVGKSTYSKQLVKQHPEYKLIHTDEYLKFGDYGSYDALRMLILDVTSERNKLIVEGSLCYRLLRQGVRENNFKPKLIIHVGASFAIRQLRRPEKDYSKTDMIYKTIWADYMNILNYDPRIEYVDTTVDLI